MGKSRTRKRTFVPYEPQELWQIGILNISDVYVATYGVNYDSDTMTDVVTPGFKKLIADGAVINNPCVYKRVAKSQNGPGSQITTKRDQTASFRLEGPLTDHYVISSGIGSALWADIEPDPELPQFHEDRSKQVALGAIDNTPYAFGEDVLELRETLRFLRNPVDSLYKLSVAFKRVYRSRKSSYAYQMRARKGLVDAHASTWLQFRFAASPLVRSCMDALEAYSSTEKSLPERLTARGFSIDTYENAGTVVNGDFTFDRNIKVSMDHHASILYTVSNPVYDWKYRLGFRAKDLPTTLWQVMPYSFMVDRALDISTFSKGVINLLDPKVTILGASHREKKETVKTYTASDRADDATWTRQLNADTLTETTFQYERKPWSPSVLDAIPRSTPGGLVNSATNIADLIALTLSNFRR